jgi:hypothetical protein
MHRRDASRRGAARLGRRRRCFQPHTSHFQFKNNENLLRIGEAVAYRYPLTTPTSHSRAKWNELKKIQFSFGIPHSRRDATCVSSCLAIKREQWIEIYLSRLFIPPIFLWAFTKKRGLSYPIHRGQSFLARKYECHCWNNVESLVPSPIVLLLRWSMQQRSRNMPAWLEWQYASVSKDVEWRGK